MKLRKPESWENTALEALATLTLGGDWGKGPEFDAADYTAALCIRGSEFRNWNEDRGRTASLRKVKKTSLASRALRIGDILVEISGGGPDQPVGRTVLIDKISLSHSPNLPKICTNFLRLFRPSGEIDSCYLNLFLQFFYKSGDIRAYQAGSNNLRNLKFDDYLGIEIPIPPISEQRRIVAKIEELFSELDKGIESLKTAQAQLKVYRQALLKHAFDGKLTAQWRAENPDKLEAADELLERVQQERTKRYQQQFSEWKGTGKSGGKPKPPKPLSPLTAGELSELPVLPDGWMWARLGQFISSIDAGKSFKCDEREPRDSEIGVAKVSAVTWGEYDEAESKTCTNSSKENPSFMIRAGDFILSRANTIDLVGACVIAKRVTKQVMLSDKTLRIRFTGYSQDYFLQFLRSRIGRTQIMKLSTGNQESMRNIGQERICSIAVPICTENEASVILEALESKLSDIDQLDQTLVIALRQSEALRQSVLKKAFLGQLVPQDPADEPATELLARIKAERSASPKNKKASK